MGIKEKEGDLKIKGNKLNRLQETETKLPRCKTHKKESIFHAED
jgi:hypothetical protein